MALEAGQIRRLVLESVLGMSHSEPESTLKLVLWEVSVMLECIERGARHMVHLMAEGQFSKVQ